MLKSLAKLNDMLGDVSSYVYAIVTLIICYDVVMRYVFSAPTDWALELSIILAGSQFMLGGLKAAATDTHIRIDGFYQMAGPALRRWLDVFAYLVAIFYLFFASLYAWKTAIKAIRVGETSASVWDSPSPTIIKTVIAVSLTLIALQFGAHLIERLMNKPQGSKA